MQSRSAMHKAFLATILVNGIIGGLDMIVGLFFIFKDTITRALYPFMSTIAGPVLAWGMATVSDHAQMGAFYFFSHGIVKLFLVWGLSRKKLWAYPISIAFLSGFTLYQLYSLADAYSTFVAILFVINLIVILVIAHEYRRIRRIFKKD